MFRIEENPAILPGFVYQHSVALPVPPSDPSLLLPNIPLPSSLCKAVPKRRMEFLAGRYCALRALALHDPAGAFITVSVSPDRAPIWPEGVVGSITHTSTFASAAVASAAKTKSLGIDAEEVLSEP